MEKIARAIATTIKATMTAMMRTTAGPRRLMIRFRAVRTSPSKVSETLRSISSSRPVSSPTRTMWSASGGETPLSPPGAPTPAPPWSPPPDPPRPPPNPPQGERQRREDAALAHGRAEPGAALDAVPEALHGQGEEPIRHDLFHDRERPQDGDAALEQRAERPAEAGDLGLANHVTHQRN